MWDWMSGVGDWFGSLFGSGGSGADVASSVSSDVPTADVGTGFSGVQADAPYSGYSPSVSPSAGDAGGSGDGWFTKMMSGASGLVDKAGGLGGILNTVGSAAKLGTTALGGMAAIQNMQQGAAANKQAKRLTQNVVNTAQPLATTGAMLSGSGASALMGGALPSGLQAQVDEYKQQLVGQLRDQYARSGIDVSTQMAQIMEYANERANAYAAQLATNLYNQGITGANAGMAPQQSIASGQYAQADKSASAAGSATDNIFKILAS